MITRKNKLEVGKTYSWTVCELVNNGKVAVIQSHGVTHVFYLDADLISNYNDTMKSLYEDIIKFVRSKES